MPELDFQITGVELATGALAPLLHFKLRLTTSPVSASVQAVLLNIQVQLQPPQRGYSPVEKERLVELFGPPQLWGQTLRNRLWVQTQATVSAFTGSAETTVPVPCSYDLNVAATKYFFGLEGGDVSLLFLFSGSIFYANPDGRLQVQPISWNKESEFRIPVRLWQELMEAHYPNISWFPLSRDVFSRLYAWKRRNAIATWEQAIDELLALAEKRSAAAATVDTEVAA